MEQSILLSPYHNCDSPNCIAGFPICACAAMRLLKPTTAQRWRTKALLISRKPRRSHLALEKLKLRRWTEGIHSKLVSMGELKSVNFTRGCVDCPEILRSLLTGVNAANSSPTFKVELCTSQEHEIWAKATKRSILQSSKAKCKIDD